MQASGAARRNGHEKAVERLNGEGLSGATPRVLVGPDGQPLVASLLEAARRGDSAAARTCEKLFGISDAIFGGGEWNSYLTGLSSIELPARARARDPLTNHVWVFAAAIARANMAGQAPFFAWRETEKELGRRRQHAKELGRSYRGPRYGVARRAWHRHMRKSVPARLLQRAAEPDLEHPIMDVLAQPNPFQDEGQLWQSTFLWLSLRNECFWVLARANGDPIELGDMPEMILPIGPDCFRPIHERSSGGLLIGWEYSPPRWAPGGGTGTKLNLAPHELVHFCFPSTTDPTRGLSPITAAAESIETDMELRTRMRSLLKNNAVPKGAVTYEGTALTQAEEEEYLRRWQERHEGARNAGRLMLLANGFKWQDIAYSPVETQDLEVQKWNREGVLAGMATPPSVIGVTEFVHYSVQLGQDRNFIEKCVMPMWRMIERALDGTLFFNEGDNVFGMFDLREIEALRAGLQEKINAANIACGQNLHMPPRTAFELHGIDVPEYEGDDVAFVGALSTPVADVLSGDGPGGALPGMPGAPPTDPDGETDEGAANDDGEDEDASNAEDDQQAAARARRGRPGRHASPQVRGPKSRRRYKGKRQRQFLVLEEAVETRMRKRYRGWVGSEKAATLARFDVLATRARRLRRVSAPEVMKQIDLTAILPDLKASGDALKARTRPLVNGALEAVWEFTLEELGVPTFAIDDAAIVSFFDRWETRFSTETPSTILTNLRQTLVEGINAEESIQQLRLRVSQVYDLSRSSSRSLMVARTNSAGFLNGTRNEMFGLAGVDKSSWGDAADENVRDDHVTFGGSGEHVRGFNYLELVGDSSGVLAYPGDLRAPVGQVANCRCLELVA